MGIASGFMAVGSPPQSLLARLGAMALGLLGEAPRAARFATDGSPNQVALAHREMHRLRHAAGGTLQCLGGSVWITLDGESAEQVIEAGQSWHLPPSVSAIAYALEPAVLRVRPAAEATSGPGSAA